MAQNPTRQVLMSLEVGDCILIHKDVIPFLNQKEEPGPSVKENTATADEKPMILPETLKAEEPTAVRNESLTEVEHSEDCRVEYTELALDCLDLKAQEELLSPTLSGDYIISLTDLASFIMSPFL